MTTLLNYNMECLNKYHWDNVWVHIYSSTVMRELEVVLVHHCGTTILTWHARIAWRDRDWPRNHRTTGRAPQALRRHIMCCTPDSAPWRHKLNCVGREKLLLVYRSHHLRRRPVQASHELCQNLNISHYETGIMMQPKRCCHRLVPTHVFYPVFRRSAEEASRLWCPHVFHHTGVMKVCLFVCWSLTSLCHSNGHIETMPAWEINPFTALTRIRSQFLRTQWSTSNHSEWTQLRFRPLSHRGWRGHEGGFRKPGPNRLGCCCHHTMSSWIDSPAYCSRPVATGLVLVGHPPHQKVPPVSSLDRCLGRHDTSRLRGPALYPRWKYQLHRSSARSPMLQLAPYPPGTTTWSGGTDPCFPKRRPMLRPTPETYWEAVESMTGSVPPHSQLLLQWPARTPVPNYRLTHPGPHILAIQSRSAWPGLRVQPTPPPPTSAAPRIPPSVKSTLA